MTDEVLAPAEPAAPQTDALTEQAEGARALDVKPQAEEPKPEPKSPDEARRDAVRKAVDEATKEPEEDEAKDEGAKEKAKPPAAEEKADASRSPDGKFAKVDPEGKPRPTAFREAPQRFDEAARAEWDAVPESVRGAIHRSQKEMEAGIEKYRADSEAYESVRAYDDLARKNGGNLAQSLRRVIDIEQAFMRNPVEGFQRIADHFRIDLHKMAHAIASQTPQQIVGQRAQMQMSDLQRKNAELQRQIQDGEVQRQRESLHAQSEGEWRAFQAANPRAKELESIMVDFLQKYPAAASVPLRDRLADAYAFAVATSPNGAHTADPAVAQTQGRQPNPAGQKSVSGAPRGEQQSSPRKLSRRDAVAKAARMAGIH